MVIFGENESFDHYFGTYPPATNTSGEPFYATPRDPVGRRPDPALLTANPNGANPRRLDPANVNDILTCDQNHDYTPEQVAFDNGKMDMFTAATGPATQRGTSPTGQASDVMNYYDGNTVTALGNYAQNFAMSDNSFGTGFGPSAPGAINVVSGETGGVDANHAVREALTDGDTVGSGTGDTANDGQTLISDAQPYWDDCSSRDAVAMTGTDVGDQLNAEHHEPFQYYASTANPHHLAPKSLAVVGPDTATPGEFNTADHQYDTTTFDPLVAAIKGGKLPASNLPAVSFLKAPADQDAHPGYSDPLDEQQFVVEEINSIEALPDWSSTAIIVSYDDSDGWYDHVDSGISNSSQTSADALNGDPVRQSVGDQRDLFVDHDVRRGQPAVLGDRSGGPRPISAWPPRPTTTGSSARASRAARWGS